MHEKCVAMRHRVYIIYRLRNIRCRLRRRRSMCAYAYEWMCFHFNLTQTCRASKCVQKLRGTTNTKIRISKRKALYAYALEREQPAKLNIYILMRKWEEKRMKNSSKILLFIYTQNIHMHSERARGAWSETKNYREKEWRCATLHFQQAAWLLGIFSFDSQKVYYWVTGEEERTPQTLFSIIIQLMRRPKVFSNRSVWIGYTFFIRSFVRLLKF